MPETCPRGFDETLLSGAIDRELVQAAAQKVRIHLEDCAHCRALYKELTELREVAMSTTIHQPPDDQWREAPRGGVSKAGRIVGWLLAVAWLVIITAFGLYQGWQNTDGAFEKFLGFGGLGAVALLLGSVALDRWRTAKTDPYRGVEK
ncbi:MAG: zf-HC2 domain-containing protein [Acidobacteria bacterium]|nr:zf-HC2 domain-containing protein [Acidobacteriota bacterium]